MRILFLGDIIGRSGRDAVIAQLPGLRQNLKIDTVIANGENAAHGFGITPQICEDLFKAGVDCITTGNHVWDQREIIPFIEREPRLLRPANFPDGTPGRGFYIINTPRGEKILVANLMARLFMDALDDPFAAAEKIVTAHRLGRDVQVAFVDFHGEATSEKNAMGVFLDGRVSFVTGTHTHIPTADLRILPKGTGFQTDAGMCGSFQGVIGFDAELAVGRFVRKMPGERLRPAEGDVTLCGIVFDVDVKTGLCVRVQSLRLGGTLPQSMPEAA